jgi:cytochrome P450
MLDDFLEIGRTNPEEIDDNGVVSALLVNIMAGSDTTAILLRSIVYYTLKNHRVYKKPQTELDGAKLARFSYEATQNSLTLTL